MALWLLVTGSSWAQAPPLEYAVKANYLYKFGPFVEWPRGTFPTGASPFNVCVVGEDPFGPALDEATRGQAVAGHPVVIRRLPVVAGAPDCQVLYLGRTATQRPGEVLQALRGAPILTVTEDNQEGGVIRFMIRGGRVRFAVDLAAAQAGGLVISSKLLDLAVFVRPARR